MVKRKANTKGIGSESAKRRKTTSNNATHSKKETKIQPQIEPKVTRSVAKAQRALVADPTQNGGVHPLLINHILDKVFQYVIWPKATWPNVEGTSTRESIQDLCNIRLVSKQWNETATKIFRRGRSPMSYGDAHAFVPKTYDLKMEGFLDIMKNSKIIPVQRYSLGSHFFIKQNQRLMKDFMRICGPTAIELRLSFDNSSTMNFNRRSFPDLNLSKLKTLVFACDIYRGRTISNQTHEIPYLIEVLLTAAESLQEFRFETSPKDARWQSKIVKRFGEAICRKIPKTVRMLRLDLPIHDIHLDIFRETELRLEEFQFDCHFVAGSKSIWNFLENQSQNLRALKIIDSDTNGSPALDFPRFDQLSYLELQGANMKPFSYPDVFPKLETLNLTDWKTERTVLELLPFGRKAISVKEIFLPSRFAQAPLIKRASQCFPNLKAVHISPSPDITDALPEVFMYFSEIEELHITFPFLLDNEVNADSLFSGVSELDCRRIMKHRSFETVNVKDVQKKPSISSLTKLRKLVLEDSAGDVILTDFAAHFIFMKMESLKVLHTSKFRMSSKYVEMLRNKLSLKLVDDDGSEFSDESDGWSSDSSIDNDELHIIPFLGFGFNIFFLR